MSHTLESIYQSSNDILDKYIIKNNEIPLKSYVFKRLQATILHNKNDDISVSDKKYLNNSQIFANLYNLIENPIKLSKLANNIGINYDLYDKPISDMTCTKINCISSIISIYPNNNRYISDNVSLAEDKTPSFFDILRDISDVLTGVYSANTLESIYKTDDIILDTYIIFNGIDTNYDFISKRLLATFLKADDNTLNPNDMKYVKRKYEFSQLYNLVGQIDKLVKKATELEIFYDFEVNAFKIIRDIMEKRSDNVKSIKCGFENPESPLRWNEPHMPVGSTNCELTFELRGKFLSLLDRLKSIDKKVLILVSYGDAVKNFHTSNLNPHDAYNFLDDKFMELNYKYKASAIRNLYQEYGSWWNKNLDKKNWSRQQWPYNTIRYAKSNDYHLIYIQSDFTYCLWPSIYAKAMCGTLYDTSYYFKSSAFHFSGPENDLFCVGDYKIADSLKYFARKYSNVNFLPVINGNVEWLNFNNSFNNSFHDHILNKNNMDDLLWVIKRWNKKSIIKSVLNKENKNFWPLMPSLYVWFNNVYYYGTIYEPTIKILFDDGDFILKPTDIKPYMTKTLN